MKMRQCKFKNGNTQTVAWIEDKPGLQIGSLVQLKSLGKEKWEIIDMGEPKASEAIRKQHGMM